jgi:hypothetical protein
VAAESPASEAPAATPADEPSVTPVTAEPPVAAPASEAPVAPPADAPSVTPGAVEPAAEPVEDATGFVTFGAPAPPAEPAAQPIPRADEPPVPAADATPAPTVDDAPGDPAPAADVPAAPVVDDAPGDPAPAADVPAAPVVGDAPGDPAAVADDPVAPPGEEEAPRFATYVPPPPLRPPTGEPPADAPGPPADPPPAPPEVEPAAPPADPAPEPVAATVMPEALKRERDSAAAVPAAPRERGSRVFPIALGGGLVAAIVAGVLIGGGGGSDGGGEEAASSAPVTPADGGAVQLKVPAGYAALASAPALPGLDFAEGAAQAPGGRDGGRAVAFGQSVANDSTLLPPEFRRALGLRDGEVPERTPVELGPDRLQAYRYEGLRPAGIDRQVTVYMSPTSEGIATVACLAPPADAAAFKGDCEAIADTMQVSSGKPFPVGPDPAFAKLLGNTFGRLDSQVAKGRKALGRDKATFRAQAAAARDIQGAYAAAAKRLRKAEISPADQQINRNLVQRLNGTAAAWKTAARAAAKKDKRGFDRSERAIQRAQRNLARAFAGLEDAGYRLTR